MESINQAFDYNIVLHLWIVWLIGHMFKNTNTEYICSI